MKKLNNKNKIYRQFSTEEEAMKFLISNYGNFIANNNKSIDKEKTLGNALFCYTGSMSNSYNNYLYNAKGNIKRLKVDVNDFSDTANNIRLIYEAFSINKIGENIILYHYIKLPFPILKKLLKHYDNIFCLYRFMSTTLLPTCYGIKNLIYKNRYNMVFIINVDKGTPCIPILWAPSLSKLYEYEIILHPQLKLKLKKIRCNPFSNVKWHIYFDMVK